MVKHIVFWNVGDANGNSAEENIQTMTEMLEALPSKIKSIIDFEVGRDFNKSEAAFEICLYSTFRSKQDLDNYQIHPEHQKVVEFVKSVATKRAVVDYEV